MREVALSLLHWKAAKAGKKKANPFLASSYRAPQPGSLVSPQAVGLVSFYILSITREDCDHSKGRAYTYYPDHTSHL